MASDQYLRDLRDAIGRGLSSHISVEHDVPESLKKLLRRLKLDDWQRTGTEARDDR